MTREPSTLFARIIAGDIPADIVYRDEFVTAFRDINPQAPVHILIVTNQPIPSVDDVTQTDEPALGRLFTAARSIAQSEGLEQGYRLIVNCKAHGGQEIPHLHLHLLGGEAIGPMRAGA
jgi:histidine triad (HIT) family protein